jgi:vacuolar protein sorting-associated protein 54
MVPATQEMLILLTDYLKVIVNLSLLTTDTMSRIIEFLKAFNSRTCQVVLGAGAMRSAGLKNITAKHLALASQSLSIVIALIPYVRETFRRHLSQKQAIILVEFDKLKRDYQEHQNEIHTKLIAIMGDRLTAHIKSLNGIRWDVPPAKPGVNEYMELLVKETVTLSKVLSRYLASAVVEVWNYVITPLTRL